MTARTNNPDTRAWCSVCSQDIPPNQSVALVECLDWPGRLHHQDCRDGCMECRGARRDR